MLDQGGHHWGKKVNGDSLYRFVKNNLHVPTDSIASSSIWLDSPFALIRTVDSTFRDICDVISSEVTHMSLRDLKCI
jgi:hypothetical protein